MSRKSSQIMSKRRKFVVSSVLLSLGFVAVQFLTDVNRFWAIGALGVSALLLFAWSLYEGLGRNMTLLTLSLPVIFTTSVGIFWFLLPASIYTKIPIVIFYGIGIYILFLTLNIYTVSTIRTIALLRAAKGVGFVLTLVTSFLVFDAIMSLKAPIYWNILLVFIFSFLLYFQGLWSAVLSKEFDRDVANLAVVSALITSEIAGALYFWPITVVVGSLFLTVSVYVALGLGQSKLESRLFAGTTREYTVVGVLVFIAIFLATHWG